MVLGHQAHRRVAGTSIRYPIGGNIDRNLVCWRGERLRCRVGREPWPRRRLPKENKEASQAYAYEGEKSRVGDIAAGGSG